MLFCRATKALPTCDESKIEAIERATARKEEDLKTAETTGWNGRGESGPPRKTRQPLLDVGHAEAPLRMRRIPQTDATQEAKIRKGR